MRILLTGGSSFTGYWFAKTLSEAGHNVTVCLKNSLGFYDHGVRGERVWQLKKVVDIVDDCLFGEKKFINLISQHGYDVFCHHAAYVENYKSSEFDINQAVKENTNNLKVALDVMRQKNLRAVVLTGSVFEPDEGAGDFPLRAFSPYGLSKRITSEIFEYRCSELNIPLGKFVISNPFGPYEESRFCNYLMTRWASKSIAEVNTPLYVRDNIHVKLLALGYKKFVEDILLNPRNYKLGLSGYIESQADFTRRFSREISHRLKMKCEYELKKQTDFAEPMFRVNTTNALRFLGVDDIAFWDFTAEYYKRRFQI